MNGEFDTLLPRVALACGIGLLIGLERGWRTRDAKPGSRTAGVRTFAIAGLLGGIVGTLARAPDGRLTVAGGLLISVAFAAFAAVFTAFGRDENRAAQSFSATTTVAGLVTFMLGVLAAIGNKEVAAALAVMTAGVLLVREDLHEWVRKITLAEFRSVLVLLAMTLIALPVMPDRAIGPFGGVNPHEIWIIAITLATVSFAGFLAVRALGERRGVLIAAAVGGIVSSTAVIFANARDAARGHANPLILAAGSALATAVSFLRVTAIVGVLDAPMLRVVGAPLASAAAAAVAFAVIAVRWRDGVDRQQPQVPFRNPFGFFSVVGMALSMGAIMLIGRLVNAEYGAAGANWVAAISGVFDVDAMTISMIKLVPDALDRTAAGHAVLLGVASATLGKMVIGAVLGHGRFAIAIAFMSLLCLAAGGLAWAA